MPHRLLARAASRATGRIGWARGALGALLGIALAGLATRAGLGALGSTLPWIAAPLGASAVLVFALPASPLAQPWPVAGGNLLSALTGLLIAMVVPDKALAAALATGLAIGVMSIARCLHPPGGACALLGALAGTAGWTGFLPVLAINLVLLLLAGWAYNTLTGHSWPHHAPPPAPIPQGTWAGTYDEADLDAVLEDWDEVLDVSREDLDGLFRAVEQRVMTRWRNGG